MDNHRDDTDFTSWAPLFGRWRLNESEAIYVGSEDEQAYGLLRSPDSLGVAAGSVSCTMSFPPGEGDEPEPQGRIIFGFNPRTQQHYSAGIGGFQALYTVEQFVSGSGWTPLARYGRADALPRDRPLEVTVYLSGQTVMLDVDDVIVAEVALQGPLEFPYLGLVARGRGGVHFSQFAPRGESRRAFIVMQFGEPFDTLYDEVIAPVCEDLGFEAGRADEFTGPGLIIQDILEGIRGADVVIAEVTPANANVYYELGYAQAIGKPTLLLADREQLGELPFDISGFRCIFYNDTIGGKQRVEADLRRHLSSIWHVSAEQP